MIIHIENLRLRTVVGIFEWEKNVKQDVIINIEIEFDGTKAIESDDIAHTIDYKSITKKIISEVEEKVPSADEGETAQGPAGEDRAAPGQVISWPHLETD